MTNSSTRFPISARFLSERSLRWAASLLLALGLSACGGSEPAAPPETAPPPAPAASEGEASEVTFEPAFPEDVSAEGLSDEDVEQAEAAHSEDGHSHGEDGHSHGEDGHSHDEGGHSHDDGSHDDAGHAEDGHSHDDGSHDDAEHAEDGHSHEEGGSHGEA